MSNENKNPNQIDINDDKVSVNENDRINISISGTPGTIHTLDQTIEEKKASDCNTSNIKNEENNSSPKKVSITDFYLLKRNSMAIYYGWQIVCLIIFIFTAYETLQNVLPKTEIYPEPRQFFSSDSFVYDYPHGNLDAVQNKVTLSDLSFVMFYAPWSADSQYARPVFQSIAEIFYREANFMAINCWHPVDNECRQQYKKVMSWPVLMAYAKNNIAVPYTGQWTETALARFVYLLLKPINRINKPEELLTIIHNHDAVVTLFVNMETSYTFYNIFYQTAIKWLERDPQGDVAFAIVTGESMHKFGIEREPSLRFYLWNRTIEYEDEVWKSSLIHKWIIQNKQQVTTWLTPPGARSKEFDIFIQKGPVLILFTPRSLYDFPSDAYAMIRQISYEYNNCDKDEWLKEMGRRYIYNQRKINNHNYYLKTKECEKFFKWKNSVSNKCSPYEQSSFFVGHSNSSKFQFTTLKNKQKQNDYYCENIPESCNHFYQYDLDGLPTSIVDTKNDLRSSENVFTEWKNIECKMINLSKKLRSQVFQDRILEKVDNSSQFDFDKLTGIGCKTNKSLSFLAMDSLVYPLVAEKLGISLKSALQNTVAVIVDGKDESSYVLKDNLSTMNLIDFVYNYTMNKLSRHLRHDGYTKKHSYFYNSVNNQSDQSNPNVDRKYTDRNFKTITVSTISSENFTNFISEPQRTVAILFTSSQCAFCTIFSNILLTISRILNDAPYVKFARIDSDKNDLPWEYTMETVPAFLVFNNKLESRKYPSTMQVTLQNVLGFILSNLKRSNRLKAIASIVKYRNNQKQSIENTIIVLRRETEENIIDSLRAWRLNPRKRNFILRRIQALRRLYFTLHNQPYNRDLIKLDDLVEQISSFEI
ncbi:thioredoxin domain-containing protein 11 [Contarinia nasturtii]|uniref:thioredoxin domain-containing protein 11 n=1 Tax=Contarinia nasturtii TaxID=265458 RepID=UPI0012D37389|nr:thioredoxin domain-containing protein 11 [Contarinia nasturtii]